MAHLRRIQQAKRHARGDHYGAASYGRRVELFADTLSPAQRDMAGLHIQPVREMPGVDALLERLAFGRAA